MLELRHYLELLWTRCAGTPEARANRRCLLAAAIQPVHAGAAPPSRTQASLSISVILLQPPDLVVHGGPVMVDWAGSAGRAEGDLQQQTLLQHARTSSACWGHTFISHTTRTCCQIHKVG